MKIEKVIKQLESIADHTRSMAASPDADEIWKEDSDALEFAITALRSMQEAGEPLSLEQLREMDGKPVFLETGEVSIGEQLIAEWEILNWSGAGFFNFTRRKRMLHENNYGKTWLAYSYPPAHIDRSEWEPCEHCKPSDYPPDRWGAHEFPVVGNEIYFYDTEYGWEGEEIKYCPWCGRPLTEEAWAELERRLMG